MVLAPPRHAELTCGFHTTLRSIHVIKETGTSSHRYAVLLASTCITSQCTLVLFLTTTDPIILNMSEVAGDVRHLLFLLFLA
jgi:hypothetical protein